MFDFYSESGLKRQEEAPAEPEKLSFFERLQKGLSKTAKALDLFEAADIDEFFYEELETALIMSDAGMEATDEILFKLRKAVADKDIRNADKVREELRTIMADVMKPLEKRIMLGRHNPLVIMLAGVNGAGKTTTIGKLAKKLQAAGQSVLLAAGDTFRAAAREQLAAWGEKNNVTVIAQTSGDPAAVAFDAVSSAKAKNISTVIIDTAGRLPTQTHLMEELKKVKRVIARNQEDAPHEVLLVIDGNTGQNALAQVKAFDDALNLTGLIVTKLDGTAKGGVLLAIAKKHPVPVCFIGVGEQLDDLQPFKADSFAQAILP